MTMRLVLALMVLLPIIADAIPRAIRPKDVCVYDSGSVQPKTWPIDSFAGSSDIPDSVRVAFKADTATRVPRQDSCRISGRSIIADSATRVPRQDSSRTAGYVRHNVTPGTLGKAATDSTWTNSHVTESGKYTTVFSIDSIVYDSVVDGFNRVSNPLDSGWTNCSGTDFTDHFKTDGGNAIRAASGGALAVHTGVFRSDQSSWINGGGGTTGVVVRASASCNSGYAFIVPTNGGKGKLYKIGTSGTLTVIDSTISTTVSPVYIWMTAIDDTLKCYCYGMTPQLQIVRYDTSFSSGNPGMYVSSGNINSWEGKGIGGIEYVYGDSVFAVNGTTELRNTPVSTITRILGKKDAPDNTIYEAQASDFTTTVVAGTGITVTKSTDTFTVSLYQPPVISSLTNTSATNYAGQTVTGLTINWSLSGSAITSQTLTDVGLLNIADRSHIFTGLSLTTDKYYTLAVTDGTTPTSANTWVYFYIAKFRDTTSSATPNESNIEAGTTQWVLQSASNRALPSTSVTGNGKHIYYAYPASFGTVQIYVNGFATTWIQSTVSVTNAYGDTRNYYVYTSPTTIIGTIALSAVGN